MYTFYVYYSQQQHTHLDQKGVFCIIEADSNKKDSIWRIKRSLKITYKTNL